MVISLKQKILPLPGIRILEAYILSWFKWKNWISLGRNRVELTFFFCYLITLHADPFIHHLDGRIEMLDWNFFTKQNLYCRLNISLDLGASVV